jgi:tRNA wybutosine-synthesizing protein 1
MDGLIGSKMGDTDDPKEIVDKCIEVQKHLLNGFPGNEKVNMMKFKESQDPKTFAISLSGEPTIFPKLSCLLEELKKRGICSFLVTNGQFPEALAGLTTFPTQLYVSLDAPNKELYKSIDNPSLPDFWERFNRTLELLSTLKTRTVLRITAVKGMNMTDLEGYASLIRKAKPMFVEVKAYMRVGSSRDRLKEENMPRHPEIAEFSEKLAKLTGLKVIDQKPESRVCLLAEKDWPDRKLRL